MSGGTPVGGGCVRQRRNQGYFSSGDDLERQQNSGGYSSTGDDDLEDDACSRPPVHSIPTLQRARTWKEVVEAMIWLVFAAFIIYYGDRHSNLISILCWDGRIKRTALYLGLVGVALDLGLVLYSTFFLWGPQKIYEKNEALLSIAPCIILFGFLSFCLFSFALWPIWSFLSIPLLFTLFMAFMVVSPYLLIGPLRLPEFTVRAD
ncbi:uncharacterized protein [Elaeis guineensis]|uniref:Uncharacterized protein LOC105040175 isoform X3 n=1 Tax=Elaeis guineensis var. tenera TaxID=51953 RepID=A0A6I9QXP5_ELAGV|nr:uncharacterized protein LOC105040175 isoform X3 [Elaeis guineensis]XP_029118914.1 uncharacterized protein LOC105040175 isoform X3 [Elaeis guineensis]